MIFWSTQIAVAARPQFGSVGCVMHLYIYSPIKIDVIADARRDVVHLVVLLVLKILACVSTLAWKPNLVPVE